MRALVLLITTAVLAAFPVHAQRQVPFRVGEVLAYDVSFTGFVSAGTATLTVRERRNMGAGRFAYYAIAEAKPTSLVERLYHLYYKAESFLDTQTLRPSAATVFSDERGRTRMRTTKFLPGNKVEVETRTATVVKATVDVQPQSYDPLSALYALRAMPLRQGQTVVLPLVNNGRVYRVSVWVAAREMLSTELGDLQSLRLALTIVDATGTPSTTRDLTLWLSDDARRLPLRMQVGLAVGNFALALTTP